MCHKTKKPKLHAVLNIRQEYLISYNQVTGVRVEVDKSGVGNNLGLLELES